jgi:hypothetical protein
LKDRKKEVKVETKEDRKKETKIDRKIERKKLKQQTT